MLEQYPALGVAFRTTNAASLEYVGGNAKERMQHQPATTKQPPDADIASDAR